MGKLGAPNRGMQYKRFSLGLTKELDEDVQWLQSKPGYDHCNYAECLRVLIEEGAKAMKARYQETGGRW